MKIDITTVVTIIKCAIGAGSFTPKAFQIGGLWISFFLTLLLGYLCSYTLQLLVICERTIHFKIHNDNNNNNNNNDNDKKHKHSLNQYIVVNENEDCDNNTTTDTTNNNNDNNNNDNKTNEYKQLTYSEIGSYIYPGLYHQ